ncbi:sugar-binding domain-containing protein [Proteinivorax hydrogeniformans]|uniref:Sugar-binding domain-containing protein n=1 Tax=Proteinivorax hydrogeniformans TaxID=1826727 RepID=A0AAU8HV84_9FIRM
MKSIIEIQKKIAPESIDIVKKRHNILRSISYLQPIGRRNLAAKIGVGERVLRSEVNKLKDSNLIKIETAGMSLTKNGETFLEESEDYIKELLGLTNLEDLLKARLNIEKVVVIPGDSDENPLVKDEIGKGVATALLKLLKDGDVIAVTGGSTVAAIADQLPKTTKDVTVVPSRGALGEQVEIQANTIAAALANKLGGRYKLLHAPDNLSQNALSSIIADPKIASVLEAIKGSNILIHGIGEAGVLAQRRSTDPEILDKLEKSNAVAEAFGYYFDAKGNIVHQVESIGLKLTDLQHISKVIAVAGGKSKAKAIEAVAINHRQHILVTDEGAAMEILN